jgi:hypothetical protein
MREAYEQASRDHGHEPGFTQFPASDIPTAVFIADEVDRAWDEIGPHLLHDAATAASYRHGEADVASISSARTVDELRAAGGAYRVLSYDDGVDFLATHGRIPLAPLCGGLRPEVAWPYLERAAAVVAHSGV